MGNYVNLLGRLTKDVECKYTQSQMAVARFSVALDRGKDKDGNSRGADFPNCVAFGRTAENLEKFSGKGLRVSIIGHLQTGSYDKDGQKHYSTDVIADRVEFIDWKGKSESERAAAAPLAADQSAAPEGFAAIDEDILF